MLIKNIDYSCFSVSFWVHHRSTKNNSLIFTRWLPTSLFVSVVVQTCYNHIHLLPNRAPETVTLKQTHMYFTRTLFHSQTQWHKLLCAGSQFHALLQDLLQSVCVSVYLQNQQDNTTCIFNSRDASYTYTRACVCARTHAHHCVSLLCFIANRLKHTMKHTCHLAPCSLYVLTIVSDIDSNTATKIKRVSTNGSSLMKWIRQCLVLSIQLIMARSKVL